jgi:transcriptional regulator GlxA family with amidase domain
VVARLTQALRVRNMQIAILLYPGMTTLDAIGPYEVLRFMPDCDLRFVSAQPGPIVTDSGILVLGATHSYDETPAPDVILVPGSEAHTATAMADKHLVNWVKAAHLASRYTLSVCSGALILGAAGILEGHPATTHWFAQDRLRLFGAIAKRDERIVQSGKIITAAGVSAGIDLALFLVGELYGRERAERIQLLIEYDPQPPFTSGHPRKASETVFVAAREEMVARSKNPRDAISVPLILWRRVIEKVRRKVKVKRSIAQQDATPDTPTPRR